MDGGRWTIDGGLRTIPLSRNLELVLLVFSVTPFKVDQNKLEPLRGTYRGPVGHGIA